MPVEITRETSRHALGAQLPAPPPPPSQPTDEIDLRDVFSALRRRWKLVALVMFVVFALVAFMTLRQRKVYESQAKVVVATKPGGNLQMGSILDGGLSLRGGSAETQVEIINSPQTIRRAFERMPLEDRIAGFGRIDAPKWAYDIRAMRDTDVISVTVRAYKPELAAEFANAIASAYLDTDLQRNSQATKQGLDYVEKERNSIQNELSTASAKLAQFKEQTGLLAPGAQVNEVAASSAKLHNELLAARADDDAAQDKLADVRRELRAAVPEVDYQRTVAENPEYKIYRDRIAALQGELATVSQTYAAGSPERATIENQIKQAEDRLKKLSATTVSTASVQRNPILGELQTAYMQAKAESTVASARRKAVESQVKRAEADMAKFPEQERKFAEMQQRVDVLRQTYEMLSQRYYALRIEERSRVSNGILAAEAEPNPDPASPNVPRNLVLGLFLATVFAVAAGLVADHLDTKVHQVEDLERLTGLATLSLVPDVESPNTPDGILVIGKSAPVHAFLEAFRMLRNNVSFMMPDRGMKTVAVTSSSPGEGKSTVAANLAIAMAMDGKRVLLVDVDLRKPTVHQKMRVSKEVGFSNVVRGLATLQEAIQQTEWEGLECLVAGSIPPDPTEFLNMPQSHSVLSSLREDYDVVVLDSPPCVGLSDMQIVSRLTDGVLLVVGMEQATKPHVTMATKMLRQTGTRLLGQVANRMSAKSPGYYGYYGYYGSGAENPAMSKPRRSRGSKNT